MSEITNKKSFRLINTETELQFSIFQKKTLFIHGDFISGQFCIKNTYCELVKTENYAALRLISTIGQVVNQEWHFKLSEHNELNHYFSQFIFHDSPLKFPRIYNQVCKTKPIGRYKFEGNNTFEFFICATEMGESILVKSAFSRNFINLNRVGVQAIHQKENIHLQMHYQTHDDTYEGWFIDKADYSELISTFKDLRFPMTNSDPFNYSNSN